MLVEAGFACSAVCGRAGHCQSLSLKIRTENGALSHAEAFTRVECNVSTRTATPRNQPGTRLRLLATLALATLVACGAEEPTREPLTLPAVSQDSGLAPSIPAIAPARGEAAVQPRFRALWILSEGSERVLEDATRVDSLIARASALGASDLFVQVFRGGRAWYDSSLAGAAPFRDLVAGGRTDPLRDLIQGAHANGLRVHAWVNVLSLARNRTAKIVQDLGHEVVLVDRRGRSVLDYPAADLPSPDSAWYRMGTPGIYLDPGAPGVKERLAATFGELVSRYPALDGVHLDYIRHPLVLPIAPGSRFEVGLDFGYGAASQARFQAETGLEGPYADPGNPQTSKLINSTAWDRWRREKVTELVAEIGRAIDDARPGLLLSAAVIPFADRAYLSLAQDWRFWLEDRLVDFVVPMIYTRDDRLLRYQVDHFASSEFAGRIWAGLGVWLFQTEPARALSQIDQVANSALAGDALFSYDAIAGAPALYEALVEHASARKAQDVGR